MKIVAIIPAFNEEKTVGDIVNQVQTHVNTVIVINDGSTDNTEEVALKAGAEVVSHDVNKGVGAAIRTGIEKGLKRGLPWVIYHITAPMINQSASISRPP